MLCPDRTCLENLWWPDLREISYFNRLVEGCISKFESSLGSHAVRSPGCYFPVGENRRHSRRLGWGAPVSGQQFLVFRSLRGGVRAAGSGRYSPISRSPV